MTFDVLLSLVLFLTLLATLFLYFRSEKKIGSVFQDVKFRYYHGILLVIAMSSVVAVLVLIPSEAILILYLCVYFSGFFFFTYLFVPKWYLAPLTPILFIALYFARAPYWNLFTFNLFGLIFAIFISVYLGSLFTWKTTAVFVALLTAMDVINVLVTGFIPKSAETLVGELSLPVVVILPMFPSAGYNLLGLGDIFLAGLLSIQSAKKYGKKFGFASIAAITVVFLILITVLLNYYREYFPATVLVISGWLTALAGRQLYRSSLLKRD
jgi:hypothetical protein